MASNSIQNNPTTVAFTAFDYVLYAVTVGSRSVSWYALSLQPVAVDNEVSLVYRLVIASAVMLAWCLFKGETLRFSPSQHVSFIATGIFIFSTNYLLFYYGSSYVVSGLLFSRDSFSGSGPTCE